MTATTKYPRRAYIPIRRPRDQVGRLRSVEHLGGDVGPGPDAEQADAGQGRDQLVLTQRARARLDLIARLGQDGGRIRVDVLE